jgi:signal peptidase I
MMVGVWAFWIAALLPPRFSIPWILFAGAIFLTAAAFDAAQSARRSGTDFVLRRYNRWYVYAAVSLAVGLLIQPSYVDLLRSFLQAYKIPSGAMEPTLLAGDYILAKPIGKAPRRGDVVIYRSTGFSVVKRIVALGGDTVAMRDGTLFVNRVPVPERYARQPSEPDRVAQEFSWQRQFLPSGLDSSTYQPTLSTWGPLVVPPRHYFLLGDNRGESGDSRYYGFASSGSINQVPTLVYFSRDPQSGSIRWSRIGSLPR